MTRPSDPLLQRMGLSIQDTLLPPTSSMILAGSRAFLQCSLKNAPAETLIEDVFTAMVLEGLGELGRIADREPAALAKPFITRAGRGIGATGGYNAPVLTAEMLAGERRCSCGMKVWCRCPVAGDGAGAAPPSHAALERNLPHVDTPLSKLSVQYGVRGTTSYKKEGEEGAAGEGSSLASKAGSGATVPTPPGLQICTPGHIAGTGLTLKKRVSAALQKARQRLKYNRGAQQ